MNSARRRSCTRPWKNLLMPPTTMCAHSYNGYRTPFEARFAAWCRSKIQSRRGWKQPPCRNMPLTAPKGRLHSRTVGGYTRKSVPESIAVGRYLTPSLWAAVKGGRNYIHPNDKWLDFFSHKCYKKLDHYIPAFDQKAEKMFSQIVHDSGFWCPSLWRCSLVTDLVETDF